eukprot:jgi/Mesen1/2415/ME000157S01551
MAGSRRLGASLPAITSVTGAVSLGSPRSHQHRKLGMHSIFTLPGCLGLSLMIVLAAEAIILGLRAGHVVGQSAKAAVNFQNDQHKKSADLPPQPIRPLSTPFLRDMFHTFAVTHDPEPRSITRRTVQSIAGPVPPDYTEYLNEYRKELKVWAGTRAEFNFSEKVLNDWVTMESALRAMAKRMPDEGLMTSNNATGKRLPSAKLVMNTASLSLQGGANNTREGCVDFRSDGPRYQGVPYEPQEWEPTNVKELELLEWREYNYVPPLWCSVVAEERKDPCIWGQGLERAMVMEPAYFLIKTEGSHVRCYARATGAGIFLINITVIDDFQLRAEYTPQQEGEYSIWISCSSVWAQYPRAWPDEALVLPWLNSMLLYHCPHNLTVEPNPNIPPRGCSPCQGPRVGELPGQWVRTDVLRCQCGNESLGAQGEWFDDTHVWAPRECIIPFKPRREFLNRTKGAAIALVGGSTMRGIFSDLSNWLQGVGPEILQQVGAYKLNTKTHGSSWDGLVAGFLGEPFIGDVDLVLPNPLYVGNTKIAYFEANDMKSYKKALTYVMMGGLEVDNDSVPYLQPFDTLVFDFNVWAHPADRVRQKPPLMYDLDERLTLYFRSLVNLLKCTPSKMGIKCRGRFRGTIAYFSATGSFDEENYCQAAKIGELPTMGKACSTTSAIDVALKKYFKTGPKGDLLKFSSLPIAYSRPDRSIDGENFFSRKCSVEGRLCSERIKLDNRECCWPANSFPHVGSLTLTNMLVNALWDDKYIRAAGDRHEDRLLVVDDNISNTSILQEK